MLDLIDRAATLMQAQWPRATMVEFDWYAGGERETYRAVLEWPRGGTDGPRLVVFESRSGEFCCQSLAGQPFEIDPDRFQLCVPIDWAELGPAALARAKAAMMKVAEEVSRGLRASA
jgi:hypothetical protein